MPKLRLLWTHSPLLPFFTTAERIASLKSQLQEAEKEAALDKTVATMHGLQADQPKPTLGPILMASVSMGQ